VAFSAQRLPFAAGVELNGSEGDTATIADASRTIKGFRTGTQMTPPHDSEMKEATQCAKYMKALGDPIRLQMIRALQSGPKSVSDISELLELELQNVSHHLRVLLHAGLVSNERDGKFIYYSLSPDVMKHRAESAGMLDFGCCKLDLRSH